MFFQRHRRSSLRPQSERNRLRVESLEQRNMFAGLVDIQIFPGAAAGDLNLIGDLGNNEIDIQQTGNVGEFFIQGRNTTLLSLNGGGVTLPSITVNGIVGNINVQLGTGDDTFRFLGNSVIAGGVSSVPNNLTINNNDGSDRNTIQNVLVNGNFLVTKDAGATGYSELHILSSTVIGFTTVNNSGGGTGGDTQTEINNSWLQGNGGPGPAFTLVNGNGRDINEVLGNSQFGVGPFPLPGPVVSINNANGGSRTTFTGASQVAGFGTTTVYGDVSIVNADNIIGTLDIVTFNGSNVLGDVNVSNGNGDTSTTVTNSTLGSHLVAAPFVPVIGGPLTVSNGAGFDQFAMTGSTAPWGISINNDALASNTSLWGSTNTILNSFIGTGPFGPYISGAPNVAFLFHGDNGRDTFDANNTVFGGTLETRFYAGNNDLSLRAGTRMGGLYAIFLGGNDTVAIDDATITAAIYVRMGDGADRFTVVNVDPLTEWPSPLLGSVDIDLELGVDTVNALAATLGADDFEVVLP